MKGTDYEKAPAFFQVRDGSGSNQMVVKRGEGKTNKEGFPVSEIRGVR